MEVLSAHSGLSDSLIDDIGNMGNGNNIINLGGIVNGQIPTLMKNIMLIKIFEYRTG